MSNTQAITNYAIELANTLNSKLPADSKVYYCVCWGSKFHRVSAWDKESEYSRVRVAEDNRVFCFIDQETGDVLAPKGWNRRAKGVRYNVLDDASRTALFNAREVA